MARGRSTTARRHAARDGSTGPPSPLLWPLTFWAPEIFAHIEDPDDQPARRPIGIDAIAAGGAARTREVRERVILETPFYALSELALADLAPNAPSLLLVMPMSGHHSLLLRDLAGALLRDRRVFLLDWINARWTPPGAGAFGFGDNIGAVVAALRAVGPGAHLVGLCQSGPAAAAAAAALHQLDDPARPAALALLGSPIDPAAAPTRVARTLAASAPHWLDLWAIEPVPSAFPGAGRRVYPAHTHQRALLAYLARHFWRNGPLWRKVAQDDGANAGRFPFIAAFANVKDIPAEAFLENIAAVYRDRLLPRGALRWNDLALRPDQAADMALLTVEAEHDDVAAPGQTAAAHRLFSAVRSARRDHLTLRAAGHFGL
ncbi:MAG: hypothetical protein AAFR16_06850, partial [Pseudomonadota bacterium]